MDLMIDQAAGGLLHADDFQPFSDVASFLIVSRICFLDFLLAARFTQCGRPYSS